MKKTLVLVLLVCSQMVLEANAWTKKEHAWVDCSKEFVLAADVTATNTVVGLFELTQKGPVLVVDFTTKTLDITSITDELRELVEMLIQDYGVTVQTMSIASPGTVNVAEKTIEHPHMPWPLVKKLAENKDAKGIDGQAIEKAAKIGHVSLINDFQAGAFGVQHSAITSKTLQVGQAQNKGTKAVVGAGNGLGVGVLIWDEATGMYQPHPLNYSFTEFGAHDLLELKYYDFLERTIGINAYGKVLGGSGGVIEMYKFLNEEQSSRYKKTDPYVEYKSFQELFANRDTSLRCKDAVDFFMKQYIRLIRNVIYAQNAVGGIYITNSIAENNPELFEGSDFIQELVDFNPSVSNVHTKYLKGYLSKIPVHLVYRNENMQLYGAALHASKLQ